MPKVSQSYREDRRREILDAAVRCFAREGFHRATVHDVVKESGLSLGAIYNYFASKEEIIEAIAEDRWESERKVFAAAQRESSFAAAVNILLHGYLGELKSPGEKLRRRVSIQLWAEAQRNRKVHAVVRTNIDTPRKLLIELLRKGRKQGKVAQDVDVDAAARFLIALFYGLVLQVEWDQSVAVRPQARLIERFLKSLGRSA
jgi:AcrR family transcriptional regulator